MALKFHTQNFSPYRSSYTCEDFDLCVTSFVHIALRVNNNGYDPLSERIHDVCYEFAFETVSCDRISDGRKMFADSDSHRTESNIIILRLV